VAAYYQKGKGNERQASKQARNTSTNKHKSILDIKINQISESHEIKKGF
jgi:hypothetical protein